jgi:GMP synthase-like glutamine amidotransferase
MFLPRSHRSIAAINDQKRQYGVQFDPEAIHTRHGFKVLNNFVFDICGCERDWELMLPDTSGGGTHS